jgi:ornithine cyclodeaminase/alanine dehydrogenase-like protein (mu-crystallin family)
LTRIPVFGRSDVEAAVSPERAVDVVRDAFLAYARGEWSMPSKVYVPAYPAGDFRAMPALGGGFALLKWVTSFPGNPELGLPTVAGLVLLSDASNGMPVAVLDAGAVTALRTGAAAVLAAETLAGDAGSVAAVIGAGVNGRAAARTFLARGRQVAIWDLDSGRAAAAASELGADLAPSREEALAADVVATVTPGHEVLYPAGSLRAGQHVSLMGADGPGKAEISVEELGRVRVFCDDWEQADPSRILDPNARVRLYADDWEQASHNGDLAHAVEAGAITEDDVAQLGGVLAGTAAGRQSKDDITIFDSTGLAIQDLAIALAAIEEMNELQLPLLDL